MKKVLIQALVLGALAGCTKRFITIAPQSQANEENYYKTANDFNTAVIGAYSTLQSLPSGIYLPMSAYRSDELYLSAPTAGTQDQYDINRFQETSANTIITNAWADYYTSIADCNQVIAQIGAAAIGDSLTSQYSAEARFLRALNYFDLVRYWGAVPLVLTPVTPVQSLTIGRSDTGKVYAAIESDLLYAAAHLPAVFSGANLGRATSGAATTLLSDVYLTEKKFTQAESVLQPLLNGAYQLLPTISSVFSVNNKMNTEIIFAVRYNKTVTGQGHGLWFSVSDTSTSPITPSLPASYPVGDKRRALLYYSKVGNNYVINKYLDTLNSTTNQAANDYILYRYADVLLMTAEAVNEGGYDVSGTGPAWVSLNKVHQRAGLAALTPAQLPDQNSFRLAVQQERRWELALEGHRWFDLVRTGLVSAAMQSNEGITVAANQLIYPIPETEIEIMSNPAIFPQNPGY
jgi:hypothetical protein